MNVELETPTRSHSTGRICRIQAKSTIHRKVNGDWEEENVKFTNVEAWWEGGTQKRTNAIGQVVKTHQTPSVGVGRENKSMVRVHLTLLVGDWVRYFLTIAYMILDYNHSKGFLS